MRHFLNSAIILLTLATAAQAAGPTLLIEVLNPQTTYEVGQSVDFRILLRDAESLAFFEVPVELSFSDPSAAPGTDFHFVSLSRPSDTDYVFRDDGFGLAAPPSDMAAGTLNDFVLPPALGGVGYDTTSPHNVVAIGSIVSALPGTLTFSITTTNLRLLSDFDIDFDTGGLFDEAPILGFADILGSLPSQSFEFVSPAAIPEPSGALMAAIGAGIIALIRLKSRTRA